MSKYTNYFPLGIAKGVAFCNRVSERKKLINNIQRNKHSLVISARRYGKSSLVLFSLEEIKLPYERVDLFVAVSAKTIQEQILKGVTNLLAKINTAPEQIIILVKNHLKKMKSRWIVGTDGVNIQLIPEKDIDPALAIMSALQMLENVLKKKNKEAIFFIDEFQEIGVLANSSGIEGAIRNVAQESEFLRFIFSGSNRHVLANMFDDRASPLYMLCDRVSISRISEKDYSTYLNKVATKTWNTQMKGETIKEIFKLSERHPYYFNVLCDKVWTRCVDNTPEIDDIKEEWNEYILQEESKIAKELSSLNTSSKKILIAIAHGVSQELTSKEVLKEFNLTSAAVVKSLKILEEKDYVYKNKDEYFILDPLIKASLKLFYPDVF